MTATQQQRNFGPTFAPELRDGVLRNAGALCDYAGAHAPSTPEAMRASKRVIDGWYFDDGRPLCQMSRVDPLCDGVAVYDDMHTGEVT